MAITNSSTLPSQSLPDQSAQLQLHDIHLPEQVHNFPIAPGWWLLLALLVISTVWLYKKRKQRIRVNAGKKQALTVLENNPLLSAKECITLLKWAAMQYINRQQLAKLYGEGFQLFLMKQLPEKHQANFTKLSTAAFQGQYKAEQAVLNTATTNDIDRDCQQATKLWLTHALPIKGSLVIDKPFPMDNPTTVNKPMPVEKEKELSE